MMVNKLGIAELAEGDIELVNDLLRLMQDEQLDYTLHFNHLAENLTQTAVDDFLNDIEKMETQAQDQWQLWLARWYRRISDDVAATKRLMERNNPLVIPRNHHVEAVLESAQESGDLSALHEF